MGREVSSADVTTDLSTTRPRHSINIWFTLIALLFIMFWVTNYITPLMSDDYNYRFHCETGERIENIADIFPSMAYHYAHWNGHVTVHFCVQLMLMLGKPVFNVVNSLMSIILLLGLCRLTTGRRK